MEEEVLYKKSYTMRALGENGLNTSVSVPPAVIQREAEKRGLTIDVFRERFVAVAQYNNIEGVLYTFKERPSKDAEPNQLEEIKD